MGGTEEKTSRLSEFSRSDRRKSLLDSIRLGAPILFDVESFADFCLQKRTREHTTDVNFLLRKLIETSKEDQLIKVFSVILDFYQKEFSESRYSELFIDVHIGSVAVPKDILLKLPKKQQLLLLCLFPNTLRMHDIQFGKKNVAKLLSGTSRVDFGILLIIAMNNFERYVTDRSQDVARDIRFFRAMGIKRQYLDEALCDLDTQEKRKVEKLFKEASKKLKNPFSFYNSIFGYSASPLDSCAHDLLLKSDFLLRKEFVRDVVNRFVFDYKYFDKETHSNIENLAILYATRMERRCEVIGKLFKSHHINDFLRDHYMRKIDDDPEAGRALFQRFLSGFSPEDQASLQKQWGFEVSWLQNSRARAKVLLTDLEI